MAGEVQRRESNLTFALEIITASTTYVPMASSVNTDYSLRLRGVAFSSHGVAQFELSGLALDASNRPTARTDNMAKDN
jgi:hypothetical protein